MIRTASALIQCVMRTYSGCTGSCSGPVAAFAALIKPSPADIKQGSYVGVTGKTQPQGSQRALEVHIFPEAMRGTGDGHRPWDLQASSTMTNGNVEQTAAGTDGQSITLKY